MEAQGQLDEIRQEYSKLFEKINDQKNKYKNIVFLLSEFIDQLIMSDQRLVDGEMGEDPQVDIHLDLDLIKNAEDFE